jgi:quercetin dioxygenase-like cupin family protein
MPSPIKNYYDSNPDLDFPGAGRGARLLIPADCDGLLQSERVILTATDAFPQHFHPQSNHVIFVTQGDGQLSWVENQNQQSIGIRRGDHFVVEKGLIHSISAGSEGLEFLVVNLPPIPLEDKRYMTVVHTHKG